MEWTTKGTELGSGLTATRALMGMMALLGLAACDPAVKRELNGVFKGSDGANQSPSSLEWRLAVTGDGLLAGIWKGGGDVPDAQLSGKLGLLRNQVTLYVPSGRCKGEFTGDFTFQAPAIRGKLGGNAACPDRTFNFDLTKAE